ncbi:hypothetical protein MXL79_05340 [Serratia ureilytica]|uniref:hypothetical protein n=1 Tax=Serratia ureilytica TaxID=300181 RepID=UPI002DBA3206|nr:hypothetical protein [Serratia ureilytica]MEB5992577.1 hypothetical protein [Serratia ureilytica]
MLQRKQDGATMNGRFIPAVKIRLLRAENLRDFSAAAGGVTICQLFWYFLFLWFFILFMSWLIFLYSVKSMLLITPILYAINDSNASDSGVTSRHNPP